MSSDEQQLDPPLEVDESASKDAGAEGSKSDGPVEKKAESLGDDDRGDDQLVIDEPEEKSDVDSEEKEFEPTIDMMMNDFDDERTMEEEENEDDQENDEDELAALEQEQDMPIEELMKLYNYGAPPPALAVGGSSGPSNEKESGSKTNGEKDSDNAKVSDQIEPHKLTGDAHVAAMESSDRDEDDDVDEQTGKRRGSMSPTQPNKKSRSELARFYEAAVEGRALRSQGGGQPDDIEEEDDDDPDDSDFEGRDYSWKKTIMIGPSYQASVPLGLSAYGDTLPYGESRILLVQKLEIKKNQIAENEDKLLWNPENLGTDEVEDYLTKSQESVQSSTGVGSLPLGAHVRDDEQALFMLLQCNFNKDEALRRKRMNAVPAAETMSLWSEEECRAFELGLRLYGKDFHMIQNQKVRTRSVGELVQFYYLWKKTERHDVFANTTRLEKKKYILHPGKE